MSAIQQAGYKSWAVFFFFSFGIIFYSEVKFTELGARWYSASRHRGLPALHLGITAVRTETRPRTAGGSLTTRWTRFPETEFPAAHKKKPESDLGGFRCASLNQRGRLYPMKPTNIGWAKSHQHTTLDTSPWLGLVVGKQQ